VERDGKATLNRNQGKLVWVPIGEERKRTEESVRRREGGVSRKKKFVELGGGRRSADEVDRMTEGCTFLG